MTCGHTYYILCWPHPPLQPTIIVKPSIPFISTLESHPHTQCHCMSCHACIQTTCHNMDNVVHHGSSLPSCYATQFTCLICLWPNVHFLCTRPLTRCPTPSYLHRISKSLKFFLKKNSSLHIELSINIQPIINSYDTYKPNELAFTPVLEHTKLTFK